jgi:hypothetical protein
MSIHVLCHPTPPHVTCFDIERHILFIDRVTRHVLVRRRWRRHRPPIDVVEAAERVRVAFDAASLAIVLDYLAVCPKSPGVRAGAAAWNLGGYVFDHLARHEEEMRRLLGKRLAA